MRLKLSQDRQGRPCDDWECSQLVEMSEQKMQVGQLSCLDITGELPDTNQSCLGHLSGVRSLPIPCPPLPQSLAKRLQGGTRPDCGAYGNTCSQWPSQVRDEPQAIVRLLETLSHHGTVATHKSLPSLVLLSDADPFRVHHVWTVCLHDRLPRASML